jgi:uncharacterized FlgJ-related protein
MSALFFIIVAAWATTPDANMPTKINPKVDSWLFWGLLLLGVSMAYILGRGDRADALRMTQGADTTADRVLTEIISSWIPDRMVTNEAGVIAEPFTARFGSFPDTVISLAKMVQEKYSVPAPVTLAQWALESGFGRNRLGDNNFFGHTFAAVKGFMAQPAYVIAYDHVFKDGTWKRVAVRFAKYKSIAECFMVHGEYLSTCDFYERAFRTKTLKGFVRELAKHYAQDPDYAVKLVAIIDRYNLEGKCR